MMTIKEVERRCNEIAASKGRTFKIPVMENGRLRSTYGRVLFRKKGNKCVPIKMEFSSRLLKGSNDEIEETIRHELAHYFVITDTGESHGHDGLWKKYAKAMGCIPLSGVKKKTVDTETGREPVRYRVVCTKCGKTAGEYRRRGKVINSPGRYRSRCCNAPVKVVKM